MYVHECMCIDIHTYKHIHMYRDTMYMYVHRFVSGEHRIQSANEDEYQQQPEEEAYQ